MTLSSLPQRQKESIEKIIKKEKFESAEDYFYAIAESIGINIRIVTNKISQESFPDAGSNHQEFEAIYNYINNKRAQK